ncbi:MULTISPECIES: histidine phosphatase family protein [Nocardioides]|uniref:Histidine phosphatase family protein n=1 Tax=Nocardioides vastitatis TaxID=2568655 RepID=A0ABW0ZKH9_9ACTN|nr:histidine phosphatase family protein [Nocardioides sp.]THI98679.1 histidine phosphatase family protein [Nocardioides sp.]
MPDQSRRIVLLRHGRTAWNAARRIQGQLDPELDDVGIAQARAVAPALAALEPALLWSSDLARARQTADEVAKECGLTASYDQRLREFALGEYQGLTHAELEARSAEAHERFHRDEWDGIPGAESVAEVAARFVDALRDLVAELAAGETAVVVSHGASTRLGLVAFLGWPTRTAHDLRPLENCSRIDLVEQRPGQWALESYNFPAAVVA